MALLQRVVPIIRGRCNVCGDSRNLWVSELGQDALPCNHRDRGCSGCYEVVYTGPKALLLAEHDNVQCTCRALALGGDASSGGVGERAAAADISSEASFPVGECSICTEELLPASAAMRCAGVGGKKHYFHAHCLGAWARQCQSGGIGASCPECRGPVQVRPRRLGDFLRDKGSQLGAEDHEMLRTVHASAGDGGADDGWADVRKDLWKVGALATVGVAVVAAVALGIATLRHKSDDNRDGRGR